MALSFTRREFFRRMAQGASAAAALALVDPERLLWVPGAKTIFLPPAPEPVKVATGLDQLKYKVKDYEDAQFVKMAERRSGMLWTPERFIVTTHAGQVALDGDWTPKRAWDGYKEHKPGTKEFDTTVRTVLRG